MVIRVEAKSTTDSRQRPENVIVSCSTQIKRKVSAVWHHSQIGHRSEYSIERFLAFRDYYERTSIAHAITVCFLTPFPALLTALLIDCIPLRNPSVGWRANYGIWIRQFLAMFCEAVGVVFQVREVIEAGTISRTGTVKIGLGTAISSVLVTMLVAALWKFPIPFGYVLLLNVYVLLFAISMILVIGPHVLRKSLTLQQQIKSQLFIIANQGIVAVFYPIFSAVFNRLSGVQQTAFIIVMPMIKLFTKQNIANAAESCHEYIGPIVIFSVDLFNVYYVAICMQTSKSIGSTLIIMVADTFHLILALRAMFHRTNAVHTVDVAVEHTAICTSGQFFREFLELSQKVFLEAETTHTPDRRIRLFSPFPPPISSESKTFVDKLEKTGRFANDKAENRRCSSVSAKRKPDNGPTGAVVVRQPTSTIFSVKQHQVAPASPVSEQSTRSPSSSKISSAKIKISASSVGEKSIHDTLKTLFHSEYILLAEYIEFVVPMLYAPYLIAIFHLPVAAYYPNTASMTTHKLGRTVANILLYATIEFVAFVALFVLRRKLGFSPLYQLAFVLETQAPALQGHLFVWTITILHLTLAHYGVDFNIQLK